MKKMFCKSLSAFLAILVLFTSIPMLVAAQEPQTPVFTVEKLSETPTSLELVIKLSKGSFVCFDATLTVKGLTCTSVVTTEAFDDFTKALKVAGAGTADCSNKDNGKLSISLTRSCTAPMDIALYTYEKTTATGVNGSDVSLVFDDCYIDNGDETELEVTDKVVASINLPETHVHNQNGTWVTKTSSTCSAEGLEELYCTECNELAASRPIEKIPHPETHEEKTEATCTTDGCIKVICNVCSETVSETAIPATGHEKTHEDIVEATCTTDGNKKVICDKCNEVVSETTIPATNHDKTHEVVVEPTCTTDGNKKVICDKCNEVVSETIIPATGHEKTHEDIVEATCTTDGNKKVICDKCNEVLSETPIPATGHEKTHEVVVDATCTKDGSKKTVCDKCDEVLSETPIPATGHGTTYTTRKEPTCTVNGSIDECCSICNEVLNSTPILAEGHPSLRMDKKSATCTEDGYVKYYCTKCGELAKDNIIKSTGHKTVTIKTDATCHTEGKIVESCTVCNKEMSCKYIPKTKHNWSSWKTVSEARPGRDGIMTRTCKICGDTQQKTIPAPVVKAESISLSAESITMYFRKTIRLYADILPQAAAYSNKVVWESSNEKVATVDENGNVTANGIGTATITASTANGKVVDTCTVTVKYSWIQLVIIYVLFGWAWYL